MVAHKILGSIAESYILIHKQKERLGLTWALQSPP